MAGNGDILDFDAANAPQDELAVQTHHITAEELYDIPEIRDLLLEAGITRDSRANLTIVAKDPSYAEFLQSLTTVQQRRFVDAGLSANYQNGSHPNYTEVEKRLFLQILDQFPGDSNSAKVQRMGLR